MVDSDASDNDESFNPFIEIGEDNEEKQFVDANEKVDKFEEDAFKFSEKIKEKAESLSSVLYQWLEQMPEPESLNINFKQATLSKKLKWEKMLTSKEKIKQLQRIFKVMRTRKVKKR